jgi:hypothetical protein
LRVKRGAKYGQRKGSVGSEANTVERFHQHSVRFGQDAPGSVNVAPCPAAATVAVVAH